jgi:hypothetical protein
MYHKEDEHLFIMRKEEIWLRAPEEEFCLEIMNLNLTTWDLLKVHK